MKIFFNKKNLIKVIKEQKDLGFIPTMGSLHKAHISLFKKSLSMCKKTIVTIFINKYQFNELADYKKYPRNLKKDIAMLKKCKVDYVYIPTNKQIYPKSVNRKIKISSFSNKLCGKFRPGHFESVVDVIDRFLKIIKPNKIFLGNKDLQQLKIIEEFIIRKKIKTKVIGCKNIREKNGIACSSRNYLLTLNNIKIASRIYKLLIKNKKKLLKNKNNFKIVKKQMYNLGVRRIDYLKMLNMSKQLKPYKKKPNYKLFVAYYLGSIRLIDNI